MSCNITAGIAKGCNDQVGGFVGLHYILAYPGLKIEKDANDVIIRVYQENPLLNFLWYFVDTSNSQASLTETYNINQNGSILGFHQSAQFFIPTTATPSQNDPTNTLHEFVDAIAENNNMVIGIETQDNGPMQGYSKKCFVFGLERPAYTVGGSKETGIQYGDNNGYTLELGADSKEPMQEIAYMAMHSNNLTEKLYANSQTYTSNHIWQLDKVAEFEGANVSLYVPPSGPPLRRHIIIQPGELLTLDVLITVAWSAACFNGSQFLPEYACTDGQGGFISLPYIDTVNYPLPTAPGVATVRVKGGFTNTTTGPLQVEPLRLDNSTGLGGNNLNTPPFEPTAKFLTITRTT